MKIGKIIKEIRTERGMKQGDLAKSCEITQVYLSQVENEVKMPSNALVKIISRELKVPISVLYYLAIEEEDVPKHKQPAYHQLSSTIESLIKSVYL